MSGDEMHPAAIVRLLYLSNERIPGPSAASIQQVNMCAAFVRAGAKVTLVRPWYPGVGAVRSEELAHFYGTPGNFCVATTPSLLSLSRPSSPGRRRIPLLGGASVWLMMSLWLYRRLRAVPVGEPLLLYSRSVNAAMIGLWLRGKSFSATRRLLLSLKRTAWLSNPSCFFDRFCSAVMA